MSRTYIEAAEHGQLIMRCIECPLWESVHAPEVMGNDPFGGVPTWKLTRAAYDHVRDAHDGKPHP